MMSTGFRSYHPYVLFLYYVATLVVVLYFNHPLFLVVALTLLVTINLIQNQGQALKQWVPVFLFMSGLFIVANPLLVSRGTHVLFYFRQKQVTFEALLYGVVTALALVSVLVVFISFNANLNGSKFLYIFRKVFPRTAFLIMVAMRFIPLLRVRLGEIRDVQHVRHLAVQQQRTWRERINRGMLIIQILLTWSLEDAIQTADAMKARGYGSGQQTTYEMYVVERRDIRALVSLVVLLVLCLVGGTLGYGRIYIYPQLGTLTIYPLDAVLLLFMSLLIGLPIYLDGWERLRWRFYK